MTELLGAGEAEDSLGTLGSWLMTDIDDHTDEIALDEVIDPGDAAHGLDRAPAGEDEAPAPPASRPRPCPTWTSSTAPPYA